MENNILYLHYLAMDRYDFMVMVNSEINQLYTLLTIIHHEIPHDIMDYHLVMTNIAWKIPKINGGLQLGKSSINGTFSTAMLNNQTIDSSEIVTDWW